MLQVKVSTESSGIYDKAKDVKLFLTKDLARVRDGNIESRKHALYGESMADRQLAMLE